MKKIQRWFWLILILTSFGCKEKAIERPNILFIMSDDHTAQAWGIYGGILKDYVVNNNIKRLAKTGMVLENVFCTNSICVPSRASIMTGKYSHKNGVYTLSEALEPDSLNVAKLLQQNGYQTAIVGKWHLKKEPSGFDHYLLLPGQGKYHNPILKSREDWEEGGKEFTGFSSDIIADQSIQWMESRRNEQPFFLMTHFKATHEPFDYPERNAHMFKGISLPEPSSLYDFGQETNGRTFKGQKLNILGERYISSSQEGNNFYPDLPFDLKGLDSIQARHKTYQKFIRDFLRSGAAINQNIGKILDYLVRENLLDNTVIIYTSDQGYFLGEHGFFDKRMIYEESLRMPFVISYPSEIPSGTRNKDIVLNIDFPSLFLDYAEVSPPASFQGQSFRSILQGETPEGWRTQMYYRYWLHQRQRPAHLGIRTARYKLAYFYGEPLNMPGAHSESIDPSWEFFDLEKDPNESYNAYSDPEYQDIIKQLTKELSKEKERAGDNDSVLPAISGIEK